MKKHEESLSETWDTIKNTNMHVMGVPGGEDREKSKNIWRNNGWKLPKFIEKQITYTSRNLNEFQVG